MPKIDYNYLFSRQSLRSLDYARDDIVRVILSETKCNAVETSLTLHAE